MLNEAIRRFKKGDESAFGEIVSLLDYDIRHSLSTFKIPGCDYDDMRALAMEEILNCIKERPSMRGNSMKKVISENDSEIKNRNFIKTSIKYRMIRELNYTRAERRIGYDITFLDENGNRYLDRKGKPLYIGVIFLDGKGYLIDKMKNTRVILNMDNPNTGRGKMEYKARELLDVAQSLDATKRDDEDLELRDILEGSRAKEEYRKEEDARELTDLKEHVKKMEIKEALKNLLLELLDNSHSTYALKKVISGKNWRVEKIKPILKRLLRPL